MDPLPLVPPDRDRERRRRERHAPGDVAHAIEAERDRRGMLRRDVGEPVVERTAGQASGTGSRLRSVMRRATLSRSWRRSTIMSMAPFSSRNSERWKPFGQRLAHRLLDDARPGEADERAGLGDHHVADEGEARRHAAHGRIGEDRDERLARGGELVQRRGGLGHLHEREETFLHARAARGGEADERQALVAACLHGAHEALARPPSPWSRRGSRTRMRRRPAARSSPRPASPPARRSRRSPSRLPRGARCTCGCP